MGYTTDSTEWNGDSNDTVACFFFLHLLVEVWMWPASSWSYWMFVGFRVSEADKKINEIMQRVLARTNAVLGDLGG